MVLVVFACFGGFGGFGTPYHFLWFPSDLLVCLMVLVCFMFLLVLVVLVLFGRVSLGHSLPFPSISIRFGGFWWFWLFLLVLVVLVVLAPPIMSFDFHQICSFV
jgi:hypothetical protein